MHLATTFAICYNLAIWTTASALMVPKARENARAIVRSPDSSDVVSPQVKANVTATIYSWLSDIETVNVFVDNTRSSESLQAISSQAAVAFVAAQGEGASNTILQQEVKLDASGEAAAQALVPKFNIIGPAINDTIYNPENLDKNLAAINGARCPPPTGAGAILEEGDVQRAAALAVGITVPPPPIPTVCNAAWGSW